MTPEKRHRLFAILTVDHYDSLSNLDKMEYRAFLKRNGQHHPSSRWHPYFFALRQIERIA